MKEITDNRELQLIEVETLERVATFCEERGIRYSLGYGTLLGAIREKGFIPWDDDIDVLMPRPDYERFCKEFSAEDLSLHYIKNDKNYWIWFAKVFDDRTLALEGRTETHETSLFVDIFPLDGFPDAKTVQRIALKFNRLIKYHYFRSRSLTWIMTHTRKRAFYKMAMVQVAKLVLKLVFYVFPKRYFAKAITKTFSHYNYDVANVFWLLGMRNAMPRSCVDSFVDVEFEGRKYKAIAGWDTYLSIRYGDYMTPPPEEERVVHHLVKAWWK